MPRFRIPPHALVLLAFLAMPSAAAAQTARLLPLDDPAHGWIARLQERGYLATLHPTALPHSWDEVAAAVSGESADPADPVAARWLRLLSTRLGGSPVADEGWIAGEIRPGIDLTSNGRLDPVRVLDGGRSVFTWGTLHVDASQGGFTASGGLRHDLYWDEDPDGLDAVLRLYMRTDHIYAGYRSGPLMVHIGRFDAHWGPHGGPGLVLSGNPRSMDALHLRLGGSRVALRSVFAELDAITGDGRFTGIAGSDSVLSGSRRRYLAAHRIDWRPTRSLALTLSESAVISGTGTGFSLKYLNPVQFAFLAVDNRPKNDENNGLLAAMLWWRLRATTLSLQFLADDFVYMSGSEPPSLALAATLVRGGLRPWLDVGAEFTAVTARAYNTHQPEGRYIYLGRGIGTSFSDHVTASLYGRVWLDRTLPGLSVEPGLTLLWQGEADFRLPIPPEDEAGTILTGVVERTIRGAVRASYEIGTVGRLFVDAGVNHLRNAAHVEGRSRTLFVVTGGVSVRLALSGPYRFGL
jgi:hypothetical protein